MGTVTAAVFSSCHCGSHVHGGGYGAYLLVHWLFHVIGWWALVPIGVIIVLGAWCRTSDRNNCS